MTDSGLRVTAEREEPGGVVCLVDVTSEQLHGLSCYLCDNPGALLAAAGHLYTATGDGGRLGWSVVACLEHRGAA
jgi:hypothetical protein